MRTATQATTTQRLESKYWPPQAIRDAGKNRAYWFEAGKYDKPEARGASRFGSELNDVIRAVIHDLAESRTGTECGARSSTNIAVNPSQIRLSSPVSGETEQGHTPGQSQQKP